MTVSPEFNLSGSVSHWRDLSRGVMLYNLFLKGYSDCSERLGWRERSGNMAMSCSSW